MLSQHGDPTNCILGPATLEKEAIEQIYDMGKCELLSIKTKHLTPNYAETTLSVGSHVS